MPLVPHTFERTTSVTDGGGTTYIRVIKTDEEVSIYKSNSMGQSKVTWSLDEAHEILDMLFVVLD